jgi:transposase
MEKSTFSMDELNNLPKDAVIMLYMQMRENFTLLSEQNKTLQHQSATIQKQNEQLIRQVEDLKQQVAILTQQRFGKHSETNAQVMGQLTFDLENQCILNETESLVENGIPEEPDITTVIVHRKKSKGKRDLNLSGIEVEVVMHECTESELQEQFPNGWHSLPDEVYKELQYIPARFKVLEHHVRIYAGNGEDDSIRRADAPTRLLPHSILTPELASAVFNAKYVNAVPINRLSEEFLRNDVNIPRQDMAGWMIRLYEHYLKPVHRMMQAEVMRSRYVHCDETPFVMPKHGKEYMWVFHSPGGNDAHPVFLYEYLGGRNGTVLRDYMAGYKGTLITDGYQPYHTLAKNSDDIKVAGCWAHARRKFALLIKSVKKGVSLTPAQKAAAEAVKRIDAMYHLDNTYKGSPAKEILDNRQQSVKPLVDAYFAWIKNLQLKSISSANLREAVNYSSNQEPFLRAFLDDPELPLDNNDAERSIKAFCVGKHSWHIIDSTRGADASALLYSIAETAKANSLKPYEYFAYLLTELKKYPWNNVPEEALEKLMPWSSDLPDSCRKTKTR